MKTIKILGTGCVKCKKTARIVEKAIEKNGLEAVVEKVEDIQKIMEYDVLSTPAVVLDEKVMISGRVPKEDEILKLFD